MLTTLNMNELQLIVNAAHGDPHTVLGMHEIELDGKECLVVRVFNPQAQNVTVIDDKYPSRTYPMDRIHSEGFFECVIPTRKKWFRYQLKFEGYEDNEWQTYDPYSFSPGISDMDIYLFNQGTHYNIYEKLGANPTVIDGVEGVLFGVWAPNAKRVSVIGEFNAWDGRRNPMRLLAGSGIWEIFIPGLKDNDRYKFEIKSSHGDILQKSDPYGKFAELRPSTTSLVYDINGYDWQDAEWYEEQKKTDKYNRPMNIYEVHMGSWKRDEETGRFLSYVELADSLVDYVKEMGYTHIEMLPIEEHPFDGSWGNRLLCAYKPLRQPKGVYVLCGQVPSGRHWRTA